MGLAATDGLCSYRYERKYLVPFSVEQNIAAVLRSNHYGFQEVFAERVVNNVYFDTALFRFFHENLQGVPDRRKIRIRWYGDRPLGGECQVEIKRKTGLVGTKEVHPVALDSVDVLAFDLPAKLSLPPEVRFELGGLRPVLFNRYSRRYFLSFDGRFRITIDRGLRYSHPSVLGRGGSLGISDATAVLELKYDCDADLEAARAMDDIPLSLAKKSKYVTGISAVYGW